MKRVVIIGGGIAALSTAYNLCESARQRGVSDELDITIIDAKAEPGGNIITEVVDGFLIEGGPDCFLSEKPWAMELCKRLGLENRLLPTTTKRGRTFVLSNGRLHLLPEGVILMVPTKMLPLVTSSLISLGGKIRMGLELFVPKRKESGDESLGDFVRRRLGQEALDKIAEPLVAGVHAGDPDTMSIKSSFPKFVELEQNYGSLIRGMLARMRSMRSMKIKASKGKQTTPTTMFVTLKGGLGELVATILSKIKKCVTIKSSTTVSGVEHDGLNYSIELEGGEKIKTDAVVIATPAYTAARLIKGTDGELEELLLSIPYVSTATVSVGYNKDDVRHPLDGFGFVVPKAEGRKIMAASWSSVKWAGRAPDDKVLIRCFIGGAKNEELVNESDETIISIVKEELKDIMGIEAEPVIARIFRWNKAMPQYTIGHQERVARIEELMAASRGLYLTGSAYHGIGISDTVREGGTTAEKVIYDLFGEEAG